MTVTFGYKWLNIRQGNLLRNHGYWRYGLWEPTPLLTRVFSLWLTPAWRRKRTREFLMGDEYQDWEYATPVEMVAKVLTEQQEKQTT